MKDPKHAVSPKRGISESEWHARYRFTWNGMSVPPICREPFDA